MLTPSKAMNVSQKAETAALGETEKAPFKVRLKTALSTIKGAVKSSKMGVGITLSYTFLVLILSWMGFMLYNASQSKPKYKKRY